MPDNNELQIILSLVDNASAGLKKVMGEAGQEVDKVKQKSKEATNTIQQGFKDASAQLRDFRRTMFLVTAAMATVISSVREAAKYNLDAKNTFDQFTGAISSLSATVGTMLQPAMKSITTVVNFLRDSIEATVAGFIKLTSFVAGFFMNLSKGPVEAYKMAVNMANEATDRFLKENEKVRVAAEQGWNLDKQKAEVVNLEKIVVKASTVMKQAWRAVRDDLGMLAGALEGAADISKDFARAAAIASIGYAIVNTAIGVTDRLANREGFPWPVPMILAGMVAAAGAIQIATIAAQKFHKGGLIRAHDGLAVDEVPIIAQTGEGVLSRRGMASLGLNRFNALNRGESMGGQYISIEINNPLINTMENIGQLVEEISYRLNLETERA